MTWNLLTTKPVRDLNGNWTDYAWWEYRNENDIHHVFIMGDIDIYSPEEFEDWEYCECDWETEYFLEAQGWFECYPDDPFSEYVE